MNHDHTTNEDLEKNINALRMQRDEKVSAGIERILKAVSENYNSERKEREFHREELRNMVVDQIEITVNEKMETSLEKVIAKQFDLEDSNNEGKNRFINLGRVPLICQSIIGIDKRLEKIEGNLSKGVWIVLGAVILGLMALLLK